jgi:hypothetical protein
MILKPHPVYGLPHAIATSYDSSTPFEQCMSSATVAIGQMERLDLSGLDEEQRDRLNAAAARLQALVSEMNRCS